MTPTISARLADFIAGAEPLPPEIEERMRLLHLDYLAVTVGGVDRDSAAAVRAAVPTTGERSALAPARLRGVAAFAAVGDAALVNGTTAHGLELDDTHEEASMHPGVVVFAAVEAVADAMSPPPGRAELLRAAAVGYDVMAAVGVMLGAAESYGRGFHPTGVNGAVAAAAAVAALRREPSEVAGHAVAIAATIAAGSLEFLSDGAWTKRLNAGNAAATGIRAADLARAGFLGPKAAFEGRDGFLALHGCGLDPERPLRLARGAGVLATSVKLYPCCRYMHGGIDLLRGIRAEHPELRLEDVERIEVGVIEAGATLVAVPAAAKQRIGSTVDAQFSMPFGAAVAIATGEATVAQFDDAPAVARELAGWMAKVECVTSPRLEAAYPRQWQAEVVVRLADGGVIEAFEAAFDGSPGAGITRGTVIGKVRALVPPAVADAIVAEALEEGRRG